MKETPKNHDIVTKDTTHWIHTNRSCYYIQNTMRKSIRHTRRPEYVTCSYHSSVTWAKSTAIQIVRIISSTYTHTHTPTDTELRACTHTAAYRRCEWRSFATLAVFGVRSIWAQSWQPLHYVHVIHSVQTAQYSWEKKKKRKHFLRRKSTFYYRNSR